MKLEKFTMYLEKPAHKLADDQRHILCTKHTHNDASLLLRK